MNRLSSWAGIHYCAMQLLQTCLVGHNQGGASILTGKYPRVQYHRIR